MPRNKKRRCAFVIAGRSPSLPRALADHAKQSSYRERVVLSRELAIRGYWDRYPSADQSEHPERYQHIPKTNRRGKTAYDVLAQDLLKFSPAQRRQLRLRVGYGVSHDTGEIFSKRFINSALTVDLTTNTPQALVSLSSLLVRAGLVDTPSEWGVNQDAPDDEAAQTVPIAIDWVMLEPRRERARRCKLSALPRSKYCHIHQPKKRTMKRTRKQNRPEKPRASQRREKRKSLSRKRRGRAK